MMVEKKVSTGLTPWPLATAAWDADTRKSMSALSTKLRPLSVTKRESLGLPISASVKPTIFQMATCTSPKLNWPPNFESEVKFCDSNQLIWSTWTWVRELRPIWVYEATGAPSRATALYEVGSTLIGKVMLRQ